MEAQTHNSSLAGEYYLKGVMEVGAGFKLNADSSFEFFFSYGALDRQAAGTWKLEGNNIVFNSSKKPATDFNLIESHRESTDSTIIFLKGLNKSISSYFYAVAINGKEKHSAAANNDGIIILPVQKVDTVELYFEWCPEKKSVFNLNNSSNNFFTFELLPGITDVIFDNWKLSIDKNKISGQLPFAKDKFCVFENK